MADPVKQLWVNRVPRFIAKQRNGIDTWPGEVKGIPVTELSKATKANINVSDILDGKTGKNVGRRVEFYMNGEHMATLYYGKARLLLTRKLVDTIYHV